MASSQAWWQPPGLFLNTSDTTSLQRVGIYNTRKTSMKRTHYECLLIQWQTFQGDLRPVLSLWPCQIPRAGAAWAALHPALLLSWWPGCSTLSRQSPWWSPAAPGPTPGTVLPKKPAASMPGSSAVVCLSHYTSTNPRIIALCLVYAQSTAQPCPAAHSFLPAGMGEGIRTEVRKLKGWDKASWVGIAKAMQAAKEEKGINSTLVE